MDHYADWFVWTAGFDLALSDRPENARIRRAIGPDKARRVLIVLAAHADADGYAWPSIARIEDLTGLGRRTVTDGLAYLIAAGVIEKAGKVGRAVRYRLMKGRGLHDASPSAKGRDLPDASDSEPSGEVTGEVSGEVSGEVPGRPRTEQEPEREHRSYGAAPAVPVARDDDARLDAIESEVGGLVGYERSMAGAMLDRYPQAAIVNAVRAERRRPVQRSNVPTTTARVSQAVEVARRMAAAEQAAGWGSAWDR